ncbi:hypothetical protein ANO14919_022270 [Xylariales sp. No.14919]|nr:hypothetical protein ANO14919_022270 [Xylariales sp. No.14919]
MARTKLTAKYIGPPTITWTRFYLPRHQEWPRWPANHADVHVGPLADVQGLLKASLGRMVENPEQAAYIIVWRTLDDLKNFQSSSACVEFLQGLPENDNMQAPIVSGLGNESSASAPPSRFLTLEHVNHYPTAGLEGRVTITAFLIPHKDESMKRVWYKQVSDVFRGFLPRGSEFIRSHRHFRWQYLTVWFWVRTEDHWVEKTLGKLENNNQDDENGRTVICEFRLWPRSYNVTPEHEESSAKDPLARESWAQALANVMPPVTAWEQERWDIQGIPRFYPPEEIDPEDLAEDLEEHLKT